MTTMSGAEYRGTRERPQDTFRRKIYWNFD